MDKQIRMPSPKLNNTARSTAQESNNSQKPLKKRRCRGAAARLDFTTIQITPPRGNGFRSLQPILPRSPIIDKLVDPYFAAKLPARVNLTVNAMNNFPPTFAQPIEPQNTQKRRKLLFEDHILQKSSPPPTETFVNGDVIIPNSIWLPAVLKQEQDITLEGFSLAVMKSLKIFDEDELKTIAAMTEGENFDNIKTDSKEYQEFFTKTFKEFNIDPNIMIDLYSSSLI